MTHMGFGAKWRTWIMGYLASSRTSVLINGSPTKEFPVSKAMEGLNMAIRSAGENALFRGIKISNTDTRISHMFYADDVIFLGEWNTTNIKNLARILRCFHVSSGLKVNFNKSKLFGIGVDSKVVSRNARTLRCDTGELPFMYLGVHVGANMRLSKNWKPLAPILFLDLHAPRCVTEAIEKLRRRFLWGGSEEKNRIHWAACEKVIASKKEGGLGAGSVRAANLSLLSKWTWRVKTERESLWSKVIYPQPEQKANLEPSKKLMVVIGDGKSTMFWKDNWTGNGPLQIQFSDIFDVSNQKICLVKDRIGAQGYFGDWKHKPRTDQETDELQHLKNLCSSITLNHENDRHSIDIKISCPSMGKIVWCNLVPLKVKCFAWCAYHRKIPSAAGLVNRGIPLPSSECQICNEETEDVEHLLLKCSSVQEIWKMIFFVVWMRLEEIQSI
ncbi:hypothetical protein LXL04_014638 [Taraxacum kok-saghyz]